MTSLRSVILLGFAHLCLTACGGGGDSDGPSDGSSARCSDFSTHSQAQSYFNSHDAPQLDADHDGSACESLPG